MTRDTDPVDDADAFELQRVRAAARAALDAFLDRVLNEQPQLVDGEEGMFRLTAYMDDDHLTVFACSSIEKGL